ncbi:hypothetical protein DFH28DRAFT_879361 [Melampsora americana]|nr:hypothetical protein DFH28DRAFT_879361 [Melampsora americana]
MPKFTGVHQAFNAQKPYWTKPPKTEAQRKHFARMAAAVKARSTGPAPLATPDVPPVPEPQGQFNVDIDPIHFLAQPDFIDEIQGDRIAEEQEERQLVLARYMQEMFYAYIECHFQTSEWGDPTKWNVDLKPHCNCPTTHTRVRPVDLVDLLCKLSIFDCISKVIKKTFADISPQSDRQKAEVTFCGCQQSDQSRLIYMGYIGGSPKYPQTAFSIWLLRFFHITWKFCTSRAEPWTRALDEYLDAFNPLILTKNKQLAENCPRCFGPPIRSIIDGEPDLVVCLDGNFQHRRHLAAGAKAAKTHIKMPYGFLPQADVTRMESRLASIAENDIDACADQHTAANDRRGKSHWGGCDETGLMAIVCRHDHPLRFANIVQSGEK